MKARIDQDGTVEIYTAPGDAEYDAEMGPRIVASGKRGGNMAMEDYRENGGKVVLLSQITGLRSTYEIRPDPAQSIRTPGGGAANYVVLGARFCRVRGGTPS